MTYNQYIINKCARVQDAILELQRMVRHDDAAIDVKDALAIADKLSEIQRQIKECHDQYESCAQDLNCVNQEGHHE